MTDAALAALRFEAAWELMDDGSRGPGRVLGLFAPDDSARCLTVRIAGDRDTAVAAVAEPYLRGRVAPEHRCEIVGYVIEPALGAIEAVRLGEEDYPGDEPAIEGLAWREPVIARAPLGGGVRFEGRPVSAPSLPFPLDERLAGALSEALGAFGLASADLHPGDEPPADGRRLPRLGSKTVVIYGEPGAVRRVELYRDLGTALWSASAPLDFGLVPQALDDPRRCAYAITLPGLRVHPIGDDGDDDEPLALGDLTA